MGWQIAPTVAALVHGVQAVELNGIVASFHRPHSQKEAKPYQVRDAKEFLSQAGVKP